MTIDKTRPGATKRTEVMERKGQNNSGAQGSSNSSHPSKKTHRDGGKVHEMWKTGTPAGTEVSSQECKVQRLS